mgnify:CR=1 FL=1
MGIWKRPDRTLVMKDVTDEDGAMWRAVRLHGDGTFAVVGHDIGPAVEQFFGCREYEFAHALSKNETTKLRQLLGVPRRGDLLAAVHERFASTDEIRRFLQSHNIAGVFWNRTGD